MGLEIQVNSLEEMCDLMCDNNIPKLADDKKTEKDQCWCFTFGYGQENAGYYVKVKGSYGEARQKMFDRFGDQWCFQYSEEEWNQYEKKKAAGTLGYPLERLLDIIE